MATLLPQSAAPLGQGPLSTIRPPAANVSVPGPLDTTNFYRMQQNVQGNLAISQRQQQIDQQNQRIEMERQRLDLAKFQTMIGATTELAKMQNEMFRGAYSSIMGGVSGSKGGGAADMMFGGLDPSIPAHYDLIQEMQGVMDSTQSQMDHVVRGLGPGNMSPETVLEASRSMSNILNNGYSQIRRNPNYMPLMNAHSAYTQMYQGIGQLEAKGRDVDNDRLNEFNKTYMDFTNQPGYYNNRIDPQRFRPEQYTYSSATAFNTLTELAKEAAAPTTTENVPIELEDGSTFIGTRTVYPDLDTVTKQIMDATAGDQDVDATFRNIGLYVNDQGNITRQKESGEPITKWEWIRSVVAPHVNPAGKVDLAKNSTPLGGSRNQAGLYVRADGQPSKYQGKSDSDVENRETENWLLNRGIDINKEELPDISLDKVKAVLKDPEIDARMDVEGDERVIYNDAGTELIRQPLSDDEISDQIPDDLEDPAGYYNSISGPLPANDQIPDEVPKEFELTLGRESSGGSNNVNPNDSNSAASVGPLQFNGALGQDFLEELGIEGYDVTKPLTDEQEVDLEAEFAEVENLVPKAVDFFNRTKLPEIKAALGDTLVYEDQPLGVKSVLISMGINHSPRGQQRIMDIARENITPNSTPREVIEAVQDARIEYVMGLPETDSFTNRIKQGLIERYRDEARVAVSQLPLDKTTLENKYF